MGFTAAVGAIGASTAAEAVVPLLATTAGGLGVSTAAVAMGSAFPMLASTAGGLGIASSAAELGAAATAGFGGFDAALGLGSSLVGSGASTLAGGFGNMFGDSVGPGTMFGGSSPVPFGGVSQGITNIGSYMPAGSGFETAPAMPSYSAPGVTLSSNSLPAVPAYGDVTAGSSGILDQVQKIYNSPLLKDASNAMKAVNTVKNLVAPSQPPHAQQLQQEQPQFSFNNSPGTRASGLNRAFGTI